MATTTTTTATATSQVVTLEIEKHLIEFSKEEGCSEVKLDCFFINKYKVGS